MAKLAQRLTRPLVVTIAANLMGSLQFGYNIGIATNIQNVLEDFMNVTISERDGEEPSEALITNLWAIIVAIYFLGGAVGTLVNRWVSKHMSRKRAFLMNNAIGVLAVVFMFTSRRSKLWELLLVGRLLIGVHTGISSGLVALYLAEISQKEIRGAVSNLHPIGLSMASLVGQVVGYPNLLGTPQLWDVIFGLAILPCVIQLLLLPSCVESPRYLMMSKMDTEAARQALQKLRNSTDVEDEIRVMQKEMDNVTETVTLVQLLKYPLSRRTTVIATLSHMALHLCGSNGVIFYSNNLFQESLGLSNANAAYVISGFGVLAIIMNMVATPLSEMAGRRTLQLVGLTGIIGTTLMITLCLILRHHVDGFNFATIAFLLVFIVFFSIGPLCVPWILTGELFAQNARPIASSVAVSGNWICGFIVAYAFSPMQKAMNDYVFLPFCACTILITIYTYFNLPETKGKTLQEIIALFERPEDSLKDPQYVIYLQKKQETRRMSLSGTHQ